MFIDRAKIVIKAGNGGTACEFPARKVCSSSGPDVATGGVAAILL